MSSNDSNYCAFYVEEPFTETNLGAHLKKDFCYYNMLKAWKKSDSSYPFKNAHDTTYNVRDDSDWEKTLKPRLHTRLSNSKNIILFLSSCTKNSKALREEIRYGVDELELPIIIVYPEHETIFDKSKHKFNQKIIDLWDKIPVLKDALDKVPTLHIPFNKDKLKSALNDKDLMVKTKSAIIRYYLQ